MNEFGQFVVSGLTMGSVYALVALGFAITYRSSGIVNFAQGEFVMLGGLIAAGGASRWDLPILVAIAVSIAATLLVGLVMGLGLMRMEEASEFRLVLVTLAAAIAIQAVAHLVFGTDPFRFRSPLMDDILRFGGVTVTLHSVFVIAVTVLSALGLAAYMRRTRWGRAMVATSVDRDAAASVGVNVRLVIILSFVLASALGALGGLIITPIAATSYHIGLGMSLKGFAGAVLGGMENPGGAVAGGFLIGMVEALGTGYLSSGYKNAIALSVLIIILMVRPQGLFGKTLRAA